MDNFKSFLASKTIWGGAAALIGGGLPVLGYVISGQDVLAARDLLESGVAMVGGALAIYGRIVATKRLR